MKPSKDKRIPFVQQMIIQISLFQMKSATKSTTKKSKRNGVSASEQHKQELADLAKVDPEFYKFLKKEDAGLLNFDIDDDDEESIPDDDPEQEIHQLPEHLEEMEPNSDDEQDQVSEHFHPQRRSIDRSGRNSRTVKVCRKKNNNR